MTELNEDIKLTFHLSKEIILVKLFMIERLSLLSTINVHQIYSLGLVRC